MDRKKLLKRLIYLILFIFLANFLADKFYWYYTIWYFDMLMHFLGGFWLGLVFFYLFPPKESFLNYSAILKILLFVLLIGVGWEVFEIIFNNMLAHMSFNTLDTFSDVFFDLSGGGLAILYFLKRIMFKIESAV